MRYKAVQDGGRVSPRLRNYKVMCCDCGLVHVVNFQIWKITTAQREGRPWRGYRVTGHKILFTVARDERATAAARRKKR